LLWDERSIRNSLLILGSLTTRFGEGRVPLPGGCKLGDRKYDLHVMILEQMGAKVWEEEDYLCTKANGKLKGCEIHLPIRSTGATENAILCGTLATGKTTVWNPHIRPEILDLIEMLRKMGAKIQVFGQKCIEIEGVDELHGVKHTVVPDNMEAITWAIASVITNGDVEIINFPFEHLEVPLVFLRESGMKFYRGENSLIVRGGTPYPVEISTGPYPGINSDMQPFFAVYGACSKGESKIVDLRFPGRYGYAEELAKMGMDYSVDGDLLKIHGGKPLHGATVKALDLRAGMALLLAGLVADGETLIEDAWQIERGYENLKEKLKQLM
jgi:UDP-N-acetylglucosamine 1-carboxyvinyltransferase